MPTYLVGSFKSGWYNLLSSTLFNTQGSFVSADKSTVEVGGFSDVPCKEDTDGIDLDDVCRTEMKAVDLDFSDFGVTCSLVRKSIISDAEPEFEFNSREDFAISVCNRGVSKIGTKVVDLDVSDFEVTCSLDRNSVMSDAE